MSKVLSGGCFCGHVTYTVTGGLAFAQSCHCSRCRKAFSAQASAMAFLDPSQFAWTSGSENLSSYVNKEGLGLQFCSTCGSTLVAVRNGAVFGVTLGTVNGDPGITLSRHIWVGSKAPWETLPEGVPCFEEGPPPQG